MHLSVPLWWSGSPTLTVSSSLASIFSSYITVLASRTLTIFQQTLFISMLVRTYTGPVSQRVCKHGRFWVWYGCSVLKFDFNLIAEVSISHAGMHRPYLGATCWQLNSRPTKSTPPARCFFHPWKLIGRMRLFLIPENAKDFILTRFQSIHVHSSIRNSSHVFGAKFFLRIGC